MNFDQATTYLLSLGNESLSMKLGLESVSRLARALGGPELAVPAAHIAGTNGKGSTSAMLAAIIQAAGLRVGLYTSPHLVNIRERIRVDGRRIPESDFARLATEVRLASESLVDSNELPAVPTFFEQVTIIAFLYFREQEVDLAVLEVGLGGRLDATNICQPEIVGLTRIARDHELYLGDTLAAIAAEKAGIIKPGVPVVSSVQPAQAMRVIRDRCRVLSSPLIAVNAASVRSRPEGEGFYSIQFDGSFASYNIRLSIRGRHQIGNAATAIHLAEQLAVAGFPIGGNAIALGLATASWPGRLEMLRSETGRTVLLDGAHNPDGAQSLRKFIDAEFKGRSVTLIFGVMSDKALKEIAEALFPAVEIVVATRIRNPRSVDPTAIEKVGGDCRVLRAETSEEALAIAEEVTPADGIICAAGSLYLVGELRSQLAPEATPD